MNRSVVIAVILSILVSVWVLSGNLGSGDQSEISSANVNTSPIGSSEEVQEQTPAFKVIVRDMKAVQVADSITLQGAINPARTITVKAETHGKIASLQVENGTRVDEGTPLVKIATDDRQARLDQAQAELKLREAELEGANQLKAKRLISGNQLEQAVANVAAARASVKRIKVELNQTNIRAPFSGIVNERHVELGDYVSSGDPILELIDDTQVKIVARVPQQHISKLQEGQTLAAELLDGTRIEGTLTYISSYADQATRTFRVEAIAKPNGSLRLGQSASVGLNLGELQAHKVSSSVLSLAADGSIFVNAVSENNTVVRYPVEIIKNDSDGVWLSGLPAELRLIVVGQAFVAEGQIVEVSIEGDA